MRVHAVRVSQPEHAASKPQLEVEVQVSRPRFLTGVASGICNDGVVDEDEGIVGMCGGEEDDAHPDDSTSFPLMKGCERKVGGNSSRIPACINSDGLDDGMLYTVVLRGC